MPTSVPAIDRPEPAPVTGAVTPPRSGGRWHRLAVWRSPTDQPAWARPALLAVAALAGLAYGWRCGSTVEIYYAAAARTMAGSWHDFLFAAFDPAGTVSVDKLPGALWVQALSVRLFGAHPWAVDLPQAVEGGLTVLALYRPVRRLAGPAAGLAATVVLAASPAVVTLDRGNIPDTLLVLLLVLAADATVAAVVVGGRRHLVAAGLWVGLAFQAKMVEAWLVLPAVAAAVLVAAAGPLRSRVLQVGAVVAVAGVVSMSWMVAVSLVPPGQRPAVDGSAGDSVFTQVFVYNGFGRVRQPSPNALLGRTLDIPVLAAPSPPPSWDRLLRGAYGRDTAWLLPAATLALAAGVVARRRRSRADPLRAGLLLWGTWLVTFAVVFSLAGTVNAYYLGALAPPIAALLGIGGVLAWRHRAAPTAGLTVVVAVAVTAAYGAWLLPPAGTGLPPWLAAAVAATGALGAATVVGATLARRATASVPGPAPVSAIAVPVSGTAVSVSVAALAVAAVVAAAILAVPVAASTSVVAEGLGSFDTPFEPAPVAAFTRSFFSAPLHVSAVLPKILAVRHGAPDLLATQTSVLAAPFIFATGQQVLPVGGYTGTDAAPSLAALRSMVATGRFHLVIAAAASTDPRLVWIARHCLHVRSAPATPAGSPVGPLRVSYCLAGQHPDRPGGPAPPVGRR